MGCNKNEKDHFVDNKHFGVAKPEGAYKVQCGLPLSGMGVKMGNVSNFYPTEGAFKGCAACFSGSGVKIGKVSNF